MRFSGLLLNSCLKKNFQAWKENKQFKDVGANCKTPSSSFRRKPESSLFGPFWAPAFAGATA
jgi:hypothetical protein